MRSANTHISNKKASSNFNGKRLSIRFIRGNRIKLRKKYNIFKQIKIERKVLNYVKGKRKTHVLCLHVKADGTFFFFFFSSFEWQFVFIQAINLTESVAFRAI